MAGDQHTVALRTTAKPSLRTELYSHSQAAEHPFEPHRPITSG